MKGNGQDIYCKVFKVYVEWISVLSSLCAGQLKYVLWINPGACNTCLLRRNFTSWPEESREAIIPTRPQKANDSTTRNQRP